MKKPTSFDEAFQVLDRAINEIDEPRLRALVDGEIRHVRREVRDGFNDRALAIRNDGKQLALVAQEFGALGWGHVEELTEKIDEDVRQNPALYIGGAIAAALVIGILVAPRRAEAYV